MLHLIQIIGGNFLAAGIVGIKMAQLDIKYGGLQLVKAGVAATIVEHIFLA